MQEFEHKGVKITLGSDGLFYAVIGGKRGKYPSVAAAKKKIDSAQEFQKFEAVLLHYGKVEKVTVTGVEKPRGKTSWRNRPMWIIDGPVRSARAVFPIEKYDELLRYVEICEESKKIKDARIDIDRAAYEALGEEISP